MSNFGKTVKTICSSDPSISSKRVLGAIGFCACLCALLYETVMMGNQLPNGYEVTLITSASLLGLDSVAKAMSSIGSKGDMKKQITSSE